MIESHSPFQAEEKKKKKAGKGKVREDQSDKFWRRSRSDQSAEAEESISDETKGEKDIEAPVKKGKAKITKEPKAEWLRFVCISDTHTMHEELGPLPRGDFLIHTGDFTTRGPLAQVEDFNEWLGRQPHKHKLVIAGNHEMALQRWEQEPEKIQEVLSNAIYLQDSAVTLEGIVFYGSPWISRKWIFLSSSLSRWVFSEGLGSMGLAFAYPSGSKKLQEKWDKIPEDVDFLLTHSPPYGILDEYKVHMGCPHLALTVSTRVRPRCHIFGHVHDAHGIHNESTTCYINAANCFEQYRTPIVFDYHVETKEIRFLKQTKRTRKTTQA